MYQVCFTYESRLYQVVKSVSRLNHVYIASLSRLYPVCIMFYVSSLYRALLPLYHAYIASVSRLYHVYITYVSLPVSPLYHVSVTYKSRLFHVYITSVSCPVSRLYYNMYQACITPISQFSYIQHHLSYNIEVKCEKGQWNVLKSY